MRIALTGDVMLGRLVDRYVLADEAVPVTYVWGDVLPLLVTADLRLINLECVISTRGAPWRPESKPFHFRARPRAIEALKAARIDLAALANNHSLDYGVEALRECLQLLDQAGILHAGAGLNLDEAMRPALLTAADRRVAVVAITDNEPAWQATPERPGTFYVEYNRFGPIEPYRTRLRQAIAAARRAADLVIVSAHVGPNWGPPSPAMQALAHAIIDLGADVYWGHSNHTPLGIEWYHARPLLYATGDFIDDYAVDPVERNDLSFLFALDVDDGRIRALRLYPTAIARFQVRRADADAARWLIERMRQRLAAWATPLVAHEDGSLLSHPPTGD